jgi:arylsulfatase A-like enzyme
MKTLFLPMLVLASSLTTAFAAQSGAAKPNVIIFLADDLGYADVGFNGCKDIPTPHIDSIARKGATFTDGYANHPVCSPSRAGLLSGRYQQRFGFENNSGPEEYSAPNFGIPRGVPILSERLKDVGYATAWVGKWHVGFKQGLRPHERGFDYTYGFHSGARTFYPNGPRQNHQMFRNGQPFDDETEYLTDAFARDSVAFIKGNRDRGKPFFLFFSFNAVHLPLEATRQYESRFPKIKDPKRKTYAGMLSALDDAIGRVMETVRDHGQEDDTLVFFYSDNGGPTHQTTSRNNPLRGFKGQMFEGGIRVPFTVQWPGKIPAGKVYRQPVMGFDVHATALAAAGLKTEGDGRNLVPYLDGSKKGLPHQSLFWRAGGNHAARVGDWKLVTERDKPDTLFNLTEDLAEQHDLASSRPQKLKELQATYAAWDAKMEKPHWIRQDRSNAEPGGRLLANSKKKKKQTIKGAVTKRDKNGDGKLSAGEYWESAVFDKVDANGDGLATLEEIRAYYRKSSTKPKK